MLRSARVLGQGNRSDARKPEAEGGEVAAVHHLLQDGLAGFRGRAPLQNFRLLGVAVKRVHLKSLEKHYGGPSLACMVSFIAGHTGGRWEAFRQWPPAKETQLRLFSPCLLIQNLLLSVFRALKMWSTRRRISQIWRGTTQWGARMKGWSKLNCCSVPVAPYTVPGTTSWMRCASASRWTRSPSACHCWCTAVLGAPLLKPPSWPIASSSALCKTWAWQTPAWCR